MGRRRSPRTVALADQVLAALRDAWPRPLTTKDLCNQLGYNFYSDLGQRVYRVLGHLTDHTGGGGSVVRASAGGGRETCWRLADAPAATGLEVLASLDEPWPRGIE
jgi:hypothetical protein